jgi:hypothetical protein
MPDREPDAIVEDAGRFASDAEALQDIERRTGRRLPSRLAPEPEDIDRRSREHDAGWLDNLRDREDGDNAG